MTDSRATLYYVHDPMCSWCWGFRTTWHQVQEALTNKVNVQYVLGGLAADTDQPMPENMRSNIRDNWQRIQQEIPGTDFNYDFWTDCSPRRSTYPACRAVIACGMQQANLQEKMLLAIQQAYYLNAKNPSDDDVLIQIADEIGLDRDVFATELNSDECNKMFEKELSLTKKLAVSSFPGLVLLNKNVLANIHVDYTNRDNILIQISKNIGVSF